MGDEEAFWADLSPLTRKSLTQCLTVGSRDGDGYSRRQTVHPSQGNQNSRRIGRRTTTALFSVGRQSWLGKREMMV